MLKYQTLFKRIFLGGQGLKWFNGAYLTELMSHAEPTKIRTMLPASGHIPSFISGTGCIKNSTNFKEFNF